MKKTRIYAVIGIFLLSFLCHFVFDFFPCILTSIFFPINESIWEHMKILFTATLLYGIIDHIILTKKNISFNNFLLQLFASAFLAIPIFLIIYLPVHYLFGEFLPLTLVLMLITYIICQYISYKILNFRDIPLLNQLSIILIIIMYIIFTYLTYYPFESYIFYDTTKGIYGIEKESQN